MNFKYHNIIYLIAVLLNSCSSFIYYPSRFLYTDPKLLNPVPIETHVTLKDGLLVHGWHFKPDKIKSKACVSFFHGNAQNRSSHFIQLFWIVNRGYELFVFDYPGYGQTAGSLSPESTVRASVEIIEYVKKQNCKKLIIYGHSLGGQIAMRSVWELRQSIKPDLLVVDSTFLSYQKIGNRVLKKSAWTWLFSPLSYIVLSDEWAIGEKIKEINDIPLIVIHTKTDEVIPFELGKEIFEKANGRKDFLIKKTGEHNSIYFGEEGIPFREKLIEKFESI